VDLDFELDGKSHKTRIWDEEPVVFVFDKANNEPRLALAVRMGQEGQAPVFAPAIPFFPSGPGAPGGAIKSGVLVDGKPFGRGYLMVELSQKSGTNWSGWFKTLISLDSAGSYTLPNIIPGEYRLRRSHESLSSYISESGRPDALPDYVKERFGIVDGRWAGEAVSNFVVRAGQTVQVPQLEYLRGLSKVTSASKN